MRSQGYFTFFFVAQKWPAAMQPAFAFLDWLLERLSLTQRAKVLAKPKWGRTQKAERLTAESRSRQQHLIAEGKTEDLLVFAQNRGPRTYDMFAYVSIARSVATPPYLQWLDPDTPELAQDETRKRIFSVSVGGELFESRIEKDARSEVLRHVEQTFLRLDCLYGYGHATEHVISSPYLFIRGNDPQSGLRIDDFDYTTHIEDIYQVNLISPAQAERIGGIQELGGSDGGVEVKRLVDERGALRGVGIYLWPYRRELAESVRRWAVNVMPAEQRVPPTYFLLVNREQLAGLGAPEMVRRNWLAEDVRILPFDFAQVRQKDIETPADSVKRTAALQELYGRIYPEVGREGRHIHEHLVDFPGLFDSHATFQRVARVGGTFEDYAKVYLGPDG
jgi:hypothetical protein